MHDVRERSYSYPWDQIGVLVSPAEPKPFYSLGKVSSTTEKYGADFLIASPVYGAVGVQRKELQDLIASVRDERFGKELAQMKALGLGILLLEGRMQWTSDGLLVGRSQWTAAQMQGLILSVQSLGFWIATTSTLDESIAWLSNLPKWLAKDRHGSLLSRPKVGAKGVWGRADNRDWGIWLLQGFSGIGYGTAAAIYDHFKGVPLQWTVTEQEIQQVKGVGKGRAKELITALRSESYRENTQENSSSRTGKKVRATSRSSPSRPEPYIELDEI